MVRSALVWLFALSLIIPTVGASEVHHLKNKNRRIEVKSHKKKVRSVQRTKKIVVVKDTTDTTVATPLPVDTSNLLAQKVETPAAPAAVCVRNFPLVTLNPEESDPISMVIPAGGSITLSYSILNQDSVECGSSTFHMEHSLEEFFTEIPIEDLVLEPGSEAGVKISATITAGLDAPDGNYLMFLVISNLDSGYLSTAPLRIRVDSQPPDLLIKFLDYSTDASLESSLLPQSGTVLISAGGPNQLLFPNPDEILQFVTISIDGVELSRGLFAQMALYEWEINSSIRPGLHRIDSTAVDLGGHSAHKTEVVCYPYRADGSPYSCNGDGSGTDPRPRREGEVPIF